MPRRFGSTLKREGLRFERNSTGLEGAMSAETRGTRIVLQVGSELRIKNNGDIIIDNPELELAADDRAADAVLMYRFDAQAGVHVLRLVDPVADHKHLAKHRRDD
jgi:hypothetical protein